MPYRSFYFSHVSMFILQALPTGGLMLVNTTLPPIHGAIIGFLGALSAALSTLVLKLSVTDNRVYPVDIIQSLAALLIGTIAAWLTGKAILEATLIMLPNFKEADYTSLLTSIEYLTGVSAFHLLPIVIRKIAQKVDNLGEKQ